MQPEGLLVPQQDESTIELAQYVAAHGLALTRFAYLVSGDRSRAEDLVQDVYLAIYRRFGSEIPADLPQAYARTAIVRAQLSLGRRRWFGERPSAELPERASSDPDPAESDQLWQLLEHLSHRQRCVLVLRYRYGCSDSEIADILSCRPATVRSLAARGLADLRNRTDLSDLGGAN